MEDVYAMRFANEWFDETDPRRWRWWGLAAARGCSEHFLFYFPILVDRFDSDPSLAPVVFAIGQALRGHIDMEKREIFGDSDEEDFDARIGPASRAIDFFMAQCAAARKAVDTWCLVARRFDGQVNKDIRKKIGMMIWDLRERADYAEPGSGGVT